MRFFVRTIALVSLALAGEHAIAEGPIVHAPAGAAVGEADGRVHVFKGLPYALPPVGNARWPVRSRVSGGKRCGSARFHAAEIPYVFGTADRTPPRWPKVPTTKDETALADAMMSYWTHFMRTGQPGAEWKAYGAKRAYMAFVDAPRPGTHLFPGMYELNEQVVCRRRASGTVPWNWNVGLVSPPLPPPAESCR